MLSVLEEIERRNAGRPYTDGSRTIELIREARNGGMYDLPIQPDQDDNHAMGEDQ